MGADHEDSPGANAAPAAMPRGRILPQPSDDLLARLRNRDHEAFHELHALYAGFVHAVATRFDPERAADVSQDVFLRLWTRIADRRLTVPDRARFSTWLYRVVANAALDAARRGRRRARWEAPPEGAIVHGPSATTGAMAARSPSPWPAALADTPHRHLLERLDLERAIAALPTRLRLPLVLRFWGGLDYDEIGVALGCRPGTVASRLHRALERLAERLASGDEKGDHR